MDNESLGGRLKWHFVINRHGHPGLIALWSPMKRTITIIDIAKLADVSIGTVDRALNNRAGINHKTKKKILEIVRQYDYKPNRLSQALANRKNIKVGVITLPRKIPFVKKLIDYVRAAAEEIRDYGMVVNFFPLKRFSAKEEAEKIQKLSEEGFDAFVIEGLDEPNVREAIDLAVSKDINVITFHSDVGCCRRLCYVGQDLRQSGSIAADLMCRFIGGKGPIFIMHGHHSVRAYEERLSGFLKVARKDFPEVDICGIEECYDDDNIAYEKITQVLKENSHIKGIFVTPSGSLGTAEALADSGKASTVHMVCYGLHRKTEAFLKSGVIDAVILQDIKSQGELPIKILFDMFYKNTPPQKEIYYTYTSIVTKHMLI